MSLTRRCFLRKAAVGAGCLYILPTSLMAADSCGVPHPFMPPNKSFKGECHNCGMKRAMWARTWHTYQRGGQNYEVCSMHCLAEASLNSGVKPENVEVALYLSPEISVPAKVYVVGSAAQGTMSMKSKLAFSSVKEAQQFANSCGGEVLSFEETFSVATTAIENENKMINNKRVKKGKIVEPVETDLCPVCGMHPVKYPSNKCQLQTKAGEVIHFCATQCLFAFLADPAKYGVSQLKVQFVWVIDYEKGAWIYGKNAYYVLGSSVRGPMGKEAFPFVSSVEADKFVETNGGTIAAFQNVSMAAILN